jgi:hypothetical protein
MPSLDIEAINRRIAQGLERRTIRTEGDEATVLSWSSIHKLWYPSRAIPTFASVPLASDELLVYEEIDFVRRAQDVGEMALLRSLSDPQRAQDSDLEFRVRGLKIYLEKIEDIITGINFERTSMPPHSGDSITERQLRDLENNLERNKSALQRIISELENV